MNSRQRTAKIHEIRKVLRASVKRRRAEWRRAKRWEEMARRYPHHHESYPNAVVDALFGGNNAPLARKHPDPEPSLDDIDNAGPLTVHSWLLVPLKKLRPWRTR